MRVYFTALILCLHQARLGGRSVHSFVSYQTREHILERNEPIWMQKVKRVLGRVAFLVLCDSV